MDFRNSFPFELVQRNNGRGVLGFCERGVSPMIHREAGAYAPRRAKNAKNKGTPYGRVVPKFGDGVLTLRVRSWTKPHAEREDLPSKAIQVNYTDS